MKSLPQKLKTSFEPILGPVLTRKLKEKDYGAIAKQVCQVGFWITAAQAGVGLALGIPGEAIMGLHRTCDDVRFLGSYPRVDGVRPDIRPGTSDADFGEAERWLARLRNGS